MNWTMPRPVLKVVAAVIGVIALGSFSLGVATAPARGRLPGERAEGGAAVVQAVEATPLSQERIEGPPPPPEPTPEELAKLEAEKKAKEAAAAAAKLAAEQNPAPKADAGAQVPAPDRVGDLLASPPPQPPPPAEDPPF
ncbi:hypothetical protein [Phenylobacterium sp.]|jgi:hypothetical protein|uniref:hypothetical protein n=1 Tax=Phenylobacterium sp. TaxID=1871053 RepID=UPI002F95A44A